MTSAVFHNIETLGQEFDKLTMRFPGLAAVQTIGVTHEKRPIQALRLAKKPVTPGTPRLIFVGCHHAREWISVETTLLIAKRVVEHAGEPRIGSLLSDAELWFIPMLNPDGHCYSTQRATQKGSELPRLWRKNRRVNGDGTIGVDLNRNYGFGWGGPGTISIPGHRMYRGPFAFSEPETRALRDLVLGGRTAGLLSYHSYGLEFAHPFGFHDAPCDLQCQTKLQLLAELSIAMARTANEVDSQGYRAIAAADHYEDQEVRGDCADWVFATTGAVALTVELRPDIDSLVGFQLEPDQILPTFEENWGPALQFAEFALDKQAPQAAALKHRKL